MASAADNSVDSPPMRIGSAPNINNLSSRRAPDDYGDAGAVNDYPSSARMAPAVPQASTNSAAAPSPPPPTRSRSSSSRDRNSNSSDSSSNSPSSAIPSFTSDSPYLHSYIDREMRNLAVLTETLRDISARARTFGKCGALMAEATRRLSSSCRLNPPSTPSEKGGRNSTSGEDVESDEQMRVMKERQESIGDEMTSVLSVLGEILDEVADAQVSMCQSLEASLSLSLEAFAGVELNEATRLRSEADVMSENAEGSFSRYMHGRHTERANMAGGVGGDGVGSNGGPMAMDAHDQHNFVTSWNKLSEHVGGSQFKTWNRAASNEFNNSSSEDGGGAPNKEPGRRLKNLRDRISKGKEDGDNIEKDPSLATAEAAANLRHNLEQMRLTQANAELKRFQLLRRLDSIKTRRNFELGESTLASLNGLRAYFHHCSDMIDGITPKLTRLQDKQAQSREKHDAQQAPWETKQRSLTNAIGEVGAGAASAGAIAEALSKGQVEDLDEHILTGHPLTLEEIESNVHFWELQRQLNIGSLYQRKPTSGVFVEGWLYKKSSSRISLNPWSRRWFILDKKGVHYLKCGGEGGNKEDNSNGNKSNSNDWMERIKVCDILLCTVREINCKSKGNPNLRFCFEIISPNSKAYLLQACGPDDYKMWVNGIRSCIEQQLVHGKLPPENMLLGSGKPSKKLGRNRSRGKSDNESSDSITDDDNANLDRRSSSEFSDDLPGNSPPTPRTGIRNPLVPKILEANTVCADCGNLDPDWASLNLGVVVCIECSGVHRSLGVHVSKVRSLRLDTCREYEYNLLVELGNERVNSIYEAGLHHQKGWTKPKGSAPRKAKEEWIKSKYLWKGFLEYLPEDGREQEDREAKFSRDLYEAARVGNLFAIQEALAKGGSVGWKNEKEGGKAALHICVVGRPPDEDDISDWKGMQCAELLIQNGSKLDAEDFDHHKALDCAVVGNGRREMIEYLSARSSPA